MKQGYESYLKAIALILKLISDGRPKAEAISEACKRFGISEEKLKE